MKKTQVKMNKQFYLGFSILNLSKVEMYRFCYDYIKKNMALKLNLCYNDTNVFKAKTNSYQNRRF